MSVSRRQWLKLAAGSVASGSLPVDLFGLSAAAAERDGVPPAGLCLLLEAGEFNLPLQRGIEAIAGAKLDSTGPRNESARLDKLVEELQLWRGHTLLGMVPEHRVLLLDEALRELGAAWLSRGEHVQLAEGYSRHRLMSSTTRSGNVEILRVDGCQHCSSTQWAELLGMGMATRALFPRSAEAVLPLVAHTGPTTPRHRTSPAAGLAVASRFISFVTRI